MARLGPPWPEPESDAVALSYPDWIVDVLVAELGAEDARAALVAMNQPPAMTLRVNPRRADTAAVEKAITRAGARVERGRLVPEALVVQGVGDPARLPAIRDGLATPQDQASQAVVAILDAAPGARVADLAAAPGGKATGIAERAGDTGCVVAVDVDPGRTRRIALASARLRLAHVHPIVADGRVPPLRDGVFERVLVDAPCTGLGVLRRRPDARWRIEPSAVAELAALQRALLQAATALVRPGGLLVYSVCTLTRAETVGIDDWAADNLAGFHAVAPPRDPWVAHGRGALLLPQAAATDGMYVLVQERG
jgi:16S rRNA (cytosine967-C5)-methyltransferase